MEQHNHLRAQEILKPEALLDFRKKSCAAAYLYDVVEFNNSLEENLYHLQTVLNKKSETGLTICPDKCSIAKEEIQYLGFVLRKRVI